MEQQYTILAKYYDKFMGDFDYKGYVAFVEKYLFGNGVDLCCGSGRVTISLAERGNNLIGVDNSVEMLNTAMTNAKKQGLKIQWLCMNVTEFEPINKLDFACCVCDGFNYLSLTELNNTISNVASYIKTGGYFVFDISTFYKLKEIVGNNVFCNDEENVSYIWSNRFDIKHNIVNMQIGFFERKSGDNYKRIDEEHFQYAHTNDDVLKILDSLWKVEVYDGEKYNKLSPTSKRALFVCKRK